MQKSGLEKIRYFSTYEEQEAAFSQSVFNLIPCRHNGPQRFWQDFKRIAGSGLQDTVAQNIAYVSSDPRDCLAFGTPQQVLAAACMSAPSNLPFRQIAADMGIELLLEQPIRTLSGGESVKLALAKVLISAGASSKLVVSSPFSWLSLVNRALFDRVLEAYRQRQVPAEILALAGEDDLEPIRPEELGGGRPVGLVFALELTGAWIDIGALVQTAATDQARARIADFNGSFASPCLLTGDNGQGKSLLAKALAGAISTRGKVAVAAGRGPGRARLLFQDVITQTLLRSFDGILGSVRQGLRDQALKLYRCLRQCCGERTDCSGRQENAADLENIAANPTLLDIKMILVAVRLAEQPPVLILDEPDWGLNRQDSIALVTGIIDLAHSLGIAVVLISHKPWWQPVAGSELRVEKRAAGETGCRFEIRLHKM